MMGFSPREAMLEEGRRGGSNEKKQGGEVDGGIGTGGVWDAPTLHLRDRVRGKGGTSITLRLPPPRTQMHVSGEPQWQSIYKQ